MSVKLSKTSKMPCKSWSLEARATCPGSRDPSSGEPWPVCAQCYATKGFYRMPNSKKSRDFNRKDWKRDGWITDMVAAIGTDEYFRWFDSGDLYHPRLAQKIYSVVKLTPKTKHWIPTKSWDVPKMIEWINLLDSLKNCVVRRSRKDINHSGLISCNLDGQWSVVTDSKATVIPMPYEVRAQNCEAYTRGGKCGDCRACWDKNVDLIVYPLH